MVGGATDTGQWFRSSEGARWYFDSGALCLDFAHTGGVAERPEWEQLRTPRDLAGWLAGHVAGYDGQGTASRTVLADAVELRAAVMSLARQAAAGRPLGDRDAEVVNGVSLQPDVPPTLPGGRMAAAPATMRQALSSVARDAVEVFGEHADRVRECGAPDCPLVFVDLSRAGNRRWCSMQRCGNRHKVRTHRARELRGLT
jgi:predicted RNA-binding Zn ribbon-like protein